MSALFGPRDYSQEPRRHPSLRINTKEPFNAEPPRDALVSSYITPADLFFKRNHGPIPLVTDIGRYHVSVCGLVDKLIHLSMADIRKLPKYTVTATLQCEGNRRTAMSKKRKVKGVGWDVCAIGNAIWGGARLCDVLELVGISKNTLMTPYGGKHVEFISVDMCIEENGGPYKASIPLRQATNPDADVLLAYEMNGKVLIRDHGYPLRAVVPGFIGARSVKWLDCIKIIEEESQGFFMQRDYKTFSPTVDWHNIVWSTRKPQMDFPVQSAICSLQDENVAKHNKIIITGYAVAGGGRGIERVDISADGGKTWFEAHRYQKIGVPYVADDVTSDRTADGTELLDRPQPLSFRKWAWVLFNAEVEMPEDTIIIAKAVDSAANVQPQYVEPIWNLRGILNTSWHCVRVCKAPALRLHGHGEKVGQPRL